MTIYLANDISCIKKYDDYMYIYTDRKNYRMTPPIQSLVDLYLSGISDFDLMLDLFIKKHQIEGSFDDIKRILQENTQFKEIFTFNECETEIKVIGEYGKRFPSELHMELTNACNLSCPHCYKKANEGTIDYLDFNILKSKVFDVCMGQVRILHLTGGEPTLHPDFEKIVDYASNYFHVQLTTNGANLWKMPVSTIKKIADIDISIYGIDQKAYEENTGNLCAYNHFLKSCALLKNNGIDFRINMVVNHKNITQLDEYVLKAIELGATSFTFALPTKTGRLIKSPNDDWHCDSEMTKYIYRYMRKAQKKYENSISIIQWERDVYTNKNSIYDMNYILPCKGGTFSWWMNEQMKFRPCAMIPEEYILLSYNEWLDYCRNAYNINWKESFLNFEKFCLANTIDPTDICYVFKKSMS